MTIVSRTAGNFPVPSAADINQLHAEAQPAFATSIDKAMACGDLLAEVKASLPHGSFTVWIESNCNFAPRSARGYMRLASNRETLEANWQGLAVLGVEESLKLLAEPKPEAEGLEDVLGELAKYPFDAPQPGMSLMGAATIQGFRVVAMIEPASPDDCFHVCVMRSEVGDTEGGEKTGTRLPIKAAALGVQMTVMGLPTYNEMEWWRAPHERELRYWNPWLWDSEAEGLADAVKGQWG